MRSSTPRRLTLQFLNPRDPVWEPLLRQEPLWTEVSRGGDILVASGELPTAWRRQWEPGVGILVLGGQEELVAPLLRSLPPPWGWMGPHPSERELQSAVRGLAEGLTVWDARSATALFREEAPPALKTSGDLSLREGEVLGLLSEGLANKEIAVRMGISENTVKYHLAVLYQKLGASNRAEAVRRGMEAGELAL